MLSSCFLWQGFLAFLYGKKFNKKSIITIIIYITITIGIKDHNRFLPDNYFMYLIFNFFLFYHIHCKCVYVIENKIFNLFYSS